MMYYTSSTVEADNLASLALDAATQLDLLKGDPNGDVNALRNFGNALARFSGLDSDLGAGPHWLDPTSSEMFSHAVMKITDRDIANLDTLNAELARIVQGFRTGSQDDITVENFKKFCLDIHRFILRARSTAGLHERGVFDYDQSYTR
jgi:hypothetical protein